MGSMNLEGDPAFQALAWEDPNWGGTTDKRGGYQKTIPTWEGGGTEFVPTKSYFDKQGQRSAKQNEAKLKAIQTRGGSAAGVRNILKGQQAAAPQGGTLLGGENTPAKTLLGL